jgi:tetratricopeptide (TPR) repeat protein
MCNWLRTHQKANLWLKAAVRMLAKEFPTGAKSEFTPFWPICKRYLPHALALLQYTQETGTTSSDGNERGIEGVEKRSHKRREKRNLTHKSIKRAKIELMRRLATWFWSQGQYLEMLEANWKASLIAEAAFGRFGRDTLAALIQLASAYNTMGKWGEAGKLRKSVLEPYRKWIGPEGQCYEQCVNNKATILSHQGKMDEALAIRRELVERFRKQYGPDSKH